MTHYKVTCDTCEKDLTETSNCEAYRIIVASEPIPSKEGFVTAMAAWPTFSRNMHFCGIVCLKEYVEKNL